MGNFLLVIASSMLVCQSNVKQLRADGERYIEKGKSAGGREVFLFVIATLLLIMEIFTDNIYFAVFLTIIILLLVCVMITLAQQAKQYKQRGEQCLKYAEIIGNTSECSIKRIAAAYPKSVEQVVQDLQMLIKEGLFPEHSLDLVHKKIVFTPKAAVQVKEASTPSQASSEGSVTAKPLTSEICMIKCANCGAENTLTGNVGECEYCGSCLISKHKNLN